MAAAAPIVAAIVTGAAVGVEMNQAKQQAKGAENAIKDQQNQLNQQIDTQKKTDQADQLMKQSQAGASQQAAISAIRAAMSANSSMGGTILTGPSGSTPAPIASKTLLGG
jgi:hypothetical protein